ncbi:MAG: type II toxin-antitoxin system prevent-host-death family antitoxin [Gemmatimonadetes bacterium]|nr:type II toxin-antitoxin system prevent-host-death family antitoxin [Gemmatimonadota bacterium]
MKNVNIHEAKTHLSRLVEEAVRGEDVVISKAGRPLVRLVPVPAREGARPLGLLAGKVRESEDWWAPDPELEALFYGTEDEEDPEDVVVPEKPRRPR